MNKVSISIEHPGLDHYLDKAAVNNILDTLDSHAGLSNYVKCTRYLWVHLTSAIFVLMTTFRVPLGVGSNTSSCSSMGRPE